MRMLCIIFSCAACLNVRYLCTFFHKQLGYRKELNIEYASSFSVPNVFETFHILRRTDEKV
jgi:hypothetical protein